MALYLVRHAKAGPRRMWTGDDRQRPLTRSGWRQAELLAERLAEHAPTRLLSSPYVRCVQTLEPLARALDREIEIAAELAECSALPDVMDLLTSVPDGSVLCSHGDMIPEVIAALERRGALITGEPDWRKATTWVLERVGEGRQDAFTTAEVWPPPDSSDDDG